MDESPIDPVLAERHKPPARQNRKPVEEILLRLIRDGLTENVKSIVVGEDGSVTVRYRDAKSSATTPVPSSSW